LSLALVEKFNLDISKEESQQLIMKYDLKNNGKFAYCDFIQSCVLLLKAKETSLMQRMKIQNAHKMVCDKVSEMCRSSHAGIPLLHSKGGLGVLTGYKGLLARAQPSSAASQDSLSRCPQPHC
jgi:hypothetical protein